ncbi:MAG: D-sedoheptulose 7-phosphate isomerase [Proteobacteria bacterium]|nr:D-sedoheptulose 7-phosphate isomerase [Pseudomonadota bacterium]
MSDLDLDAFFARELDDHERVVAATRANLAAPFRRLASLASDSLRKGGKLMFFGNGGSAADAQHLATEFVSRYRLDREPLPALALTTDTSALTAIGNDYGFEQLFARQLRALGRPGDVAIGISTSGQSPNVLRGLKAARELGIVPAALTGRGGGALVDLADPILIVPSDVTARIQEMHITLGQMLCAAVEQSLGLVPT